MKQSLYNLETARHQAIFFGEVPTRSFGDVWTQSVSSPSTALDSLTVARRLRQQRPPGLRQVGFVVPSSILSRSLPAVLLLRMELGAEPMRWMVRVAYPFRPGGVEGNGTLATAC